METANGKCRLSAGQGTDSRRVARAFFPVLPFSLLAVCCYSQSSGAGNQAQSPSRELQLSAGIERLFTSGTALVATSAEEKLYVWSWQDLDAAVEEYAAGDGLDVSWSDQGQIIVTRDKDSDAGRVHLLCAMDPRTGQTAEVANLGREWYLHKLASSQNGKHHACLLDCNSVIGDNITLEQTRFALGTVAPAQSKALWVRPIIHRNREGSLDMRGLSVSENGEYVAVAGSDGSGGWIHMASPRKGKSVWEKVPDGSSAFGAVAFAPDGGTVYAAGTEGRVYAFDSATGRTLSRWSVREGKRTRYAERITSLAASLDGRLVAAGLGPTGDVHIWDTSTGKVTLSLNTRQATVYQLAFSPNSKLLATNGVSGRTIQLWRLPEGVSGTTKPAASVFDVIRSGTPEKLDSLLEKTPKLATLRDAYGRTPLHWAVIGGREDLTRRFMRMRVDINARDFSGWTALHYWASGEGTRNAGRLLLESGAELTARAKGPKQWTPLLLAAAAGQAKAAEDFLAKDADVNARDGSRRTPLHLAADYGHATVVKVLLDHKPDLTAKTKYDGNLAIHLASEQGFEQVISVLLAGGAKVDALNDFEQTPLILAAEMNQPKAARVLLEKGANVHTLTAHGMPLHIAAREGSTRLVELLLEYGAPVNARDRNGWTPLRWIRRSLSDTRSVRLQERKDVEAILLKHGAKE